MLFLVIKEKNITICTNGVQYIIGGKEKGLTVVRISIFIYIYTHAYKHTHTHASCVFNSQEFDSTNSFSYKKSSKP